MNKVKKHFERLLPMVLLLLLVLVCACGCNNTKGEQESFAGLVAGIGESSGMTIDIASTAAEGGSEAIMITAIIEPEAAASAGVDWTIAFNDPSSEWASGKDPSGYVSLAPLSDGALQATVSCKEAFGEQIIVTATSRYSAASFASCTVDYEKRLLDREVILYRDDTVLDSFMLSEGPDPDSAYFESNSDTYTVNVVGTENQNHYTVSMKNHYSVFTLDRDFGDDIVTSEAVDSYVTIDETWFGFRNVMDDFIYDRRDPAEYLDAVAPYTEFIMGLSDNYSNYQEIKMFFTAFSLVMGSDNPDTFTDEFYQSTIEEYEAFRDSLKVFDHSGGSISGSSDTTLQLVTVGDIDFMFRVSGLHFPILNIRLDHSSIVF